MSADDTGTAFQIARHAVRIGRVGQIHPMPSSAKSVRSRVRSAGPADGARRARPPSLVAELRQDQVGGHPARIVGLHDLGVDYDQIGDPAGNLDHAIHSGVGPEAGGTLGGQPFLGDESGFEAAAVDDGVQQRRYRGDVAVWLDSSVS